MKFKKLFEKVDYFPTITNYNIYIEIQREVDKNPELILTAKWEDEWKEKHFDTYGTPTLEGTYSDGVEIDLISFNVVKITLWERSNYDLLPPSKISTFTVKVSQKIFKPIIMREINIKAVSMYKQELRDAKEKRINEIKNSLMS